MNATIRKFALLLCGLFIALPAFGLTPAQLTTLKNAITADVTLNALPNTFDSAIDIAAAFNQPAAPAFTVWVSSVPVSDIMTSASFDWTRVDNLSVGKSRIWEWMTQNFVLRCSQTNIRAGIDATWVGTQADLNVRAAIYVFCKRLATRFEKLFATGTGSDAVPATMVIEGNVSPQDVYVARNS